MDAVDEGEAEKGVGEGKIFLLGNFVTADLSKANSVPDAILAQGYSATALLSYLFHRGKY